MLGRPGGGPGDLDRVFDCLRTGGEQGGPLLEVAGGVLIEPSADLDEGRIFGDHEAGVGEALELGGGALGHLRVCGANAGHGDAGGEVDQMVAVNVYEQRVLRVVDEHGQGDAERVGDVLAAFGLQLTGTRSRELGEQAACCGFDAGRIVGLVCGEFWCDSHRSSSCGGIHDRDGRPRVVG